jgi:hypothetical protein
MNVSYSIPFIIPLALPDIHSPYLCVIKVLPPFNPIRTFHDGQNGDNNRIWKVNCLVFQHWMKYVIGLASTSQIDIKQMPMFVVTATVWHKELELCSRLGLNIISEVIYWTSARALGNRTQALQFNQINTSNHQTLLFPYSLLEQIEAPQN